LIAYGAIPFCPSDVRKDEDRLVVAHNDNGDPLEIVGRVLELIQGERERIRETLRFGRAPSVSNWIDTG
jgi:hypothetical protein